MISTRISRSFKSIIPRQITYIILLYFSFAFPSLINWLFLIFPVFYFPEYDFIFKKKLIQDKITGFFFLCGRTQCPIWNNVMIFIFKWVTKFSCTLRKLATYWLLGNVTSITHNLIRCLMIFLKEKHSFANKNNF